LISQFTSFDPVTGDTIREGSCTTQLLPFVLRKVGEINVEGAVGSTHYWDVPTGTLMERAPSAAVLDATELTLGESSHLSGLEQPSTTVDIHDDPVDIPDGECMIEPQTPGTYTVVVKSPKTVSSVHYIRVSAP